MFGKVLRHQQKIRLRGGVDGGPSGCRLRRCPVGPVWARAMAVAVPPVRGARSGSSNPGSHISLAVGRGWGSSRGARLSVNAVEDRRHLGFGQIGLPGFRVGLHLD